MRITKATEVPLRNTTVLPHPETRRVADPGDHQALLPLQLLGSAPQGEPKQPPASSEKPRHVLPGASPPVCAPHRHPCTLACGRVPTT